MTDYTHHQATAAAARTDNEKPSAPMNRHQKLAVVFLDILILAQLAFAVGFAHNHTADFTSGFFKVFFAMFIPTLIAGLVVIRKLKTVVEDDQ